jgi:hypothetical protein
MCEKRGLRKIFGPKRDEASGETSYRERRDLYSSPNIVRVIKSKIIRWAAHVARMGRGEACTGFW